MIRIETPGLIGYGEAHRRQLELVERLQRNSAEADTFLVLEHPPVFTLGRNGSPSHIVADQADLNQRQIEVVRVERGGEVTYHGPGQLVCYPIVNLKRRGLSVVDFVGLLESIMLSVVTRFGIEATTDPRNRGIWIGDRKLGSIGIAVRRSITFHGLALNVNTDLRPFSWINPCGLSGVSMTSMVEELGRQVDTAAVQELLVEQLEHTFAADRENGEHKSSGIRPKRSTPKPKWLKKRLPSGQDYERIRRLVGDTNLHTVCREARCPNQFECYGKGTATFMIMGDRCTRNCRFCAVGHGEMEPLDIDEPARIAAAVEEMKLDYAVITSVTRDDLPDGGASHFIRTIEEIRRRCPETMVEVLIPDLQGDDAALGHICKSRPAVLNHNVETVAGLYPLVRPQAIYERSLELLRKAAGSETGLVCKSGLMVGLGETKDDLIQTMHDIRECGCEILTLGQYLQPSSSHLPVRRFVPPEEFDELREIALDMGFGAVAAGPHVRSSYRAGYLFRSLAQRSNA